jgi:UDP-N-acetylglucosamine diphosphorylase / glucose-1-phosphate thymidylyltransferase / UDP-N-acetylgalactosamine diphosphorylase / glucosamine-1-phosphate N-acetyltransferase / galactosamine-1-phosphate N-acetyltransferase
MRPLTTLMPKPLLPVAGKPFMEHTIEVLRNAGITEITILLGWLQNRVIRHFGDGSTFGVSIEYLRQEERLGTAHAIGMAAGTFTDYFLTLNGDVVITDVMLKTLLDFHKDNPGNVISLTRVDQPENFGIVTLKGTKVTEIVEKPQQPVSRLANAGIYLFTPEIFDAIKRTPLSKRGEYEITDSLGFLIEEEKVSGCELPGRWVDIGMPWDLLTANELLMGMKKDEKPEIEGEVEPLATLKGYVKVGKGSLIKNGVYIEGPAVIGEGATIGPNCFLRQNVIIGDGCHIGSNVEIKNSIIMNNSNVPHHNYVGDSIIGENCNLGAGTKVANLRLNGQNVEVYLKGRKMDTGRRKLGVIMGHGVKTGINSVIDVGTVIGENAFVGPGTRIRGTVRPNSMIF